ncbi:MAG: hypothetical protein IIZ13_06895 [Renibacterium sp.]|nr:hypothetical protein [Renibacterium sp.]
MSTASIRRIRAALAGITIAASLAACSGVPSTAPSAERLATDGSGPQLQGAGGPAGSIPDDVCTTIPKLGKLEELLKLEGLAAGKGPVGKQCSAKNRDGYGVTFGMDRGNTLADWAAADDEVNVAGEDRLSYRGSQYGTFRNGITYYVAYSSEKTMGRDEFKTLMKSMMAAWGHS